MNLYALGFMRSPSEGSVFTLGTADAPALRLFVAVSPQSSIPSLGLLETGGYPADLTTLTNLALRAVGFPRPDRPIPSHVLHLFWTRYDVPPGGPTQLALPAGVNVSLRVQSTGKDDACFVLGFPGRSSPVLYAAPGQPPEVLELLGLVVECCSSGPPAPDGALARGIEGAFNLRINDPHHEPTIGRLADRFRAAIRSHLLGGDAPDAALRVERSGANGGIQIRWKFSGEGGAGQAGTFGIDTCGLAGKTRGLLANLVSNPPGSLALVFFRRSSAGWECSQVDRPDTFLRERMQRRQPSGGAVT